MGATRQSILIQCTDLWAAARAGQPQLVVLIGAAGLGKSHFLRGFLGGFELGTGLLVRDSSLLTGLLQAGFGLLQSERDPSFLSTARRYCPDLAWAVIATDVQTLEREQAWQTIALAFERLALRLGGLCLLLEDIHDFNNDDVAALRFLYRQWLHFKAPIFICASARPSLSGAVFEGLETDALLAKAVAPIKLELQRLDVLGVASLAQAMLPGAAVPVELQDWLFARSEGHPLQATELLRFLITGGALQNLGATWNFNRPTDTTVPVGLEAVLLSRLEVARAEPEAWLALTDLAVLGSNITLGVWKSLTGLRAEAMQRISRRLILLGLVRAVLKSGTALFEMAHPLYSPLLTGLLSESESKAAHARALEVSSSIGAKAIHARACEDPNALELTRVALQNYQAQYQWAAYLLHAEAALEFKLEANEKTVLLETMSLALITQQRFAQAIELLELHKLQSPSAISSIAYCLARLVRDQEGYVFTNQHIEQYNWAIRYFWTCFPMRLGLQDIALERLTSALTESQDNSWNRYYAHMSEHWYYKIYQPHRLGLQIQIFNNAQATERGMHEIPFVWYWKAEIYAKLGESERAQTTIHSVLETHRKQPDDGADANILVALGRIALAQNQYLEARAHFLAALRIATSSLDGIHQAYSHFGLYCTDFALGLEFQTHLERYFATQTSIQQIRYDAPTDLEIAWREAVQNRILERNRLTALLENALGSDCLAAARLYLLEGKDTAAVAVLKRWQPETWSENGIQTTQTRPAEHALLEGMALRKAGKKSVAIRAFETALDLARAAKQPVLEAEIRLASSLVSAAPNPVALEQLRNLNAIGHALWLRQLYPGALESLEFKAVPEHKSSIFIRTLGTFGLEQNNTLKPWKAKKARDLLALLICASLEEGSKFLSREQILDTIWTDNDPSTADGAFRVTVSRLRDALGEAGKIERDSQGRYGLSNAKLDVTHFLQSLASHDLERAIAWYDGEFLIGIELEKAIILREKIRASWRKAMLQLAFESPDHKAATLFERLLESDPLDLEALQGLAKSWSAIGANLRLLRVLEQSKNKFIEEVGDAPPELLELLKSVRSSSFTMR